MSRTPKLLALLVLAACTGPAPEETGSPEPTVTVLDALVVEAGETWEVDRDLFLEVGTLDVQGEIVAAPGVDLEIVVHGDAVVEGAIRAGSGIDASPTDADGSSVGLAGMDGGDLTLRVDGALTVTGELEAGAGGTGGDLAVEDTADGRVDAIGGAGGKGGDLVVTVGGTFHAGEGLLIVGDGGDGGEASVWTLPGTEGHLYVEGGPAGAPGLLSVDALAVVGWGLERRVGTNGEPMWSFRGRLGGGAGGAGGGAFGGVLPDPMLAGPDTAEASGCWDAWGKPGKSVTAKGDPGEASATKPGPGGPAVARATDGEGTGTGGSATAEGGKGGGIIHTLRQVTVNGETRFVYEGFVTAGDGGNAEAYGGAGGPVGGDGGDATARAGSGGSSDLFLGPPDDQFSRHHGGWGGSATASAGNGGSGASCCTPPEAGQAGGAGGVALAYGGNGGSGNTGAPGGDASARAGTGARGGDGVGPGAGGAEGGASAQGGFGGGGRNGKHGRLGTQVRFGGGIGADGQTCDILTVGEPETGALCSTQSDCGEGTFCTLQPQDAVLTCSATQPYQEDDADYVYASFETFLPSPLACAEEILAGTDVDASLEGLHIAAMELCPGGYEVFAPSWGSAVYAECLEEGDQAMLSVGAHGFARCVD